MERNRELSQWTRREWLRHSAAVAGGAVLGSMVPAGRAGAGVGKRTAQAKQAVSPGDALAAQRAQFGAIPLQKTQLRDNMFLLSGPGGNMVALTGRDGTTLVDTGVAPAGAKVKQVVESLGSPLKYVINTHWHFDHTDNNALLHMAGATLVAHENTPKRMSQTHDFGPPLAMHIPAFPAEALPQQTFADRARLELDEEQIDLVHLPPAHTDTDIYVHFRVADVLHVGDIWFNGMYPFIDVSTGGSINGMIAGATRALSAVGGYETIIVPGHGDTGDKAALASYRDMLTLVVQRVSDQRQAGASLQDVIAAKPTQDLDAQWGGGLIGPDDFVMLVYTTL